MHISKQIADLNFLIAEDDEFQRHWLATMLTNLGVGNIVEVPDGLAAWNTLQDKANRIDVSVIDLNMPNMDGMELMRLLAKENHQTSIILASALDSALLFSIETMAKAYGLDVLGTVEKPATPEALEELLKRYKTPETRQNSRVTNPVFTFADLQQALRDKEFEPLFQPKVELATGRVKGVEVFARWRHPQYGLLPPSTFISLLEENGEMDALAWIMIEKSASAHRQWKKQGYTIAVSINLSPSSLAKQGLSERISAYITQERIEENCFIFEVTESATVTNIPYFLENLARLRLKGFGVSVDDYGMGHASLQELMRIPFTELKIDRSFVAGAFSNQSLELVLSSSLEICRKLHRQSVAVGVETQQDWDFLRKLGCTYAQGYYVAKPMEGGAIPAWMKEWAHFF